MDIQDHMKDMLRYKDWDPTGLDPPGLFLPDHQDWVVAPVSINRDTLECALERSNYETILKQCRDVDGLPGDKEIDWEAIREEKGEPLKYEWGRLDEGPEDGQDFKVAHFGHWGPGWVEIILAKPGSACHRIMAEAECALSEDTVLDSRDIRLRDREWALHSLGEYIENLRDEAELPEDWKEKVWAEIGGARVAGDGSVDYCFEPQGIAEKLGFVKSAE